MTDDPDAVLDALDRAEAAFRGRATGAPEYEDHLDPSADENGVVQLRKACRLLDACRALRAADGYHTSVVEMAFAAIERSLEFYPLVAGGDTVDDFFDHDRAYDRAADLGVFDEATMERLKRLYDENRTAAYYQETVATADQADALFGLAVAVHDGVAGFAGRSHDCCCEG